MKKFWQDAALSTSASDGDSLAHNRFRQHCSNRVTLRGQRNGSSLAGDGLAERGLRRSQPRDRHAVGRARHIIQPDLVAERHRSRIAAMLAANADLEAGAGLASAHDADLHEFADAVTIDRDERIDLEDTLGNVGAEESRGV